MIATLISIWTSNPATDLRNAAALQRPQQAQPQPTRTATISSKVVPTPNLTRILNLPAPPPTTMSQTMEEI